MYHQGQWGTICDDHWGFREATVVCRMLNYSAAVFAVRYAYFGEGNSSSPIWMDNVKCRGDEQTIAACRHRGWDNHDCRHSEDAGVVCLTNSTATTVGKLQLQFMLSQFYKLLGHYLGRISSWGSRSWLKNLQKKNKQVLNTNIRQKKQFYCSDRR